MARPKKQGLEYFSFDCDFFYDEKVVAIAGEFGLKGEIVIIHLLCAIYRNGYFYKWDELAKMKMLHELPGVNAELLDKIVSRLLLWDFFDRGLFESSIVLTSKGIQKRYFEAAKWRKLDSDLPYILEFPNGKLSLMGVSHCETPIKQELIPQIKVNNKKISTDVDTKKPSPPPTATEKVESLSQQIDREISELRKDRQWNEPVCMRYSITAAELTAYLEDFRLVCRTRDKRHTSLSDAKQHFCNWLDKKKYQSQSSEDHANNSDRLQRRRGFEPTDTSSKSYDEPL
jgi:hypothetical protein